MKGVLVTLAILTAVGVAWFAFASQKKTSNSEADTQIKATDSSMLPDSSSKYIEYTGDNLESTVDKNRVLFFYANWCPICRPVDKEIRENESQIPEGYVVIRVNYNDTDTDKEEEALANKYEVTYQHTFVEIDKMGDVIQIWNGGDFNTLLEKISR